MEKVCVEGCDRERKKLEQTYKAKVNGSIKLFGFEFWSFLKFFNVLWYSNNFLI